MQGGTKAELDLGALMRKRGGGARHDAALAPADRHGGKAEIVAAVRHDVWPDVERGRRPAGRRPAAADVPGRRGAPRRRGQRAHRQGAAASPRTESYSSSRTTSRSPSPYITTSRRSSRGTVGPAVPLAAALLGHAPLARRVVLAVGVDGDQAAHLPGASPATVTSSAVPSSSPVAVIVTCTAPTTP